MAAFSDIASSGTLITAILESAGYYYQGFILDSLTEPLKGAVAFFVYITAALVVLARFAIAKKNDMGLWLLIGPPIFIAVLTTRKESYGAVWKFGQQARNQAQVEYEVAEFLQRTQGNTAPVGTLDPANASALFVNYNRLISQVVASMVSMITAARTNIDSKVFLRAELYSMMQDTQVTDNRLRFFIQTAFLRSCAPMVQAAQDVANPQNRPTRRTAAENELRTAMQTKISLVGRAIDFVTGIRRLQPGLYNAVMAPGATTAATRTYVEANPPTVNVVSGVAEDNQYAALRAQTEKENYTCQQVWSFTYAGLFQYAQFGTDKILRDGATHGVPKGELLSDLELAKGYRLRNVTAPSPGLEVDENAAELNVLSRIVASHILQDQIRKGSISGFLNDFKGRGFEMPVLAAPSESDLSFLERHRLRASEWQEKTSFVNTAATLPYYQGLALYFLAIVFPFFTTC